MPQPFRRPSEPVQIPPPARKAERSFYLGVGTRGNKHAADDVLSVEIRSASGALLGTLGTFSNLDDNATYTQRSFDVTRYHGMAIRISFTGIHSHGQPTWSLLDHVALNHFRYPPPHPQLPAPNLT